MQATSSAPFIFISIVLCPALSGIRSDPSKSFVPRTIMIGGKVKTYSPVSVHMWLSRDVGKVPSPSGAFVAPTVA